MHNEKNKNEQEKKRFYSLSNINKECQKVINSRKSIINYRHVCMYEGKNKSVITLEVME